MTIRSFRALEGDGLRAGAVFDVNKNQWKSIYEEVKEWVWQNWPKWMEEKPAWFDERMRSIIPRDMIPSLEDQKQIEAERGKGATSKKTQGSSGRRASQSGGRRRSSLTERLRGAFTVEKKNSKVTPEGEGEGMTEEDVGELMKKAMAKRGSMII